MATNRIRKKFIARGQQYAEDPGDKLTTDGFHILKLIYSANFKKQTFLS